MMRLVADPGPMDWLRDGARILAATPKCSVLYGTLFVLAAAGTFALTSSYPGFTTAFVTGLLLIGPYLASGLYIAARQYEAGERISVPRALRLLVARRTNMALFAVFLALIAAAWVRLSALLFAIKVSAFSPASGNYVGLLTGNLDPVAAAFFIGIGSLLAATVFVTSAIAIPLIVDRDAGPITAVATSTKTVFANWRPMLLWAVLIVALTTLGVLTAFIGLAVIFPLLGYATWKSYRALLD
jgi:uncharacterized membrane protein